jgi:hypothetical protein
MGRDEGRMEGKEDWDGKEKEDGKKIIQITVCKYRHVFLEWLG